MGWHCIMLDIESCPGWEKIFDKCKKNFSLQLTRLVSGDIPHSGRSDSLKSPWLSS